jgi:hypothetical protein
MRQPRKEIMVNKITRDRLMVKLGMVLSQGGTTQSSTDNTRLLMTKFGKAGKTELSDLGNRSIRFWQFQNRIKK